MFRRAFVATLTLAAGIGLSTSAALAIDQTHLLNRPPALDRTLLLRHIADIKLEDCSHAFIGEDRKLYLISPTGAASLAPAGHYHTADGGCIHVGMDSIVDPAVMRSLNLLTH